MNHRILCPILAITMAVSVSVQCSAAETQLAHMVYFKLRNGTESGSKQLVAACNKYLSGHAGTVYYSVGTLARDLDREVNDREFDVALHLVFKNKAAHEKYQTHSRHLKFIEENKSSWEKVRVFDSYITDPLQQRDQPPSRDTRSAAP